MRCKSKIDVSMSSHIGGVDHILIKGKIYKCDLYPKPGMKPSEPYYIVACEDGKFRKYNAEYFVDISEARADKLKELGI